MFGLGFKELLVILVLVLVLFGAGKLPKVMEQLGKGMSAFKDGLKQGKEDAKKAANKKED